MNYEIPFFKEEEPKFVYLVECLHWAPPLPVGSWVYWYIVYLYHYGPVTHFFSITQLNFAMIFLIMCCYTVPLFYFVTLVTYNSAFLQCSAWGFNISSELQNFRIIWSRCQTYFNKITLVFKKYPCSKIQLRLPLS